MIRIIIHHPNYKNKYFYMNSGDAMGLTQEIFKHIFEYEEELCVYVPYDTGGCGAAAIGQAITPIARALKNLGIIETNKKGEQIK